MDLITNIQKYSIHDGDGIRTTVFFKGCPLKCVWCHNPETQRFEQEIQYDAEKCTGCGVCAKVCPNGAVTMEDGRPKLDKKLCKLCGKCENFCTQGIREIVGQEYPVKTLVKELMKDLMFYEQSGGGVTLSGGEVMAMSTDYVLAIAKALKKEEVSLTIDTCGYVPYEKFEAKRRKYLPGGIAQATVRCKKKPQLLCSSGFFQCSFNGLDNQLGSVRSVR